MEHLKVNHSHSREAVYRILLEEEDFLSIHDILKKLEISYPKRISFNTVYRHLSLFVDAKLAVMIHDNFKRSYYTLVQDKPLMISVCRRCGKMHKQPLQSHFMEHNLQPHDFVTLHSLCQKCSQN